MVTRLKNNLLNCMKDSVSLANSLKGFERSGACLKLSDEVENKLFGKLTFVNGEEERVNEVISEIKKNQDKIREAALSRSLNIYNVGTTGNNFHFELNLQDFIKDILYNDPVELSHKEERKKMIIEYSSPNIAKNFHLGHFRSTIIGNFLVNLKKKLGHEVKSINYLGDWGFQVGLLLYGIDVMGCTEEQLRQNTMSKLQDIYVMANKMAFKGEISQQSVKTLVSKMETGDEEVMKKWKVIREICENSLESTYKELNVSFDEYAWESNYNKKNIEPVLKTLDSKIGLQTDSEGRTVVNVDGDVIKLLKSDGSTLYLLRDIAAYFDRSKRHNFDEMLYVVDDHQKQHFSSLKKVCSLIQGIDVPLRHVPFGRIQNMSTRKGSYTLFEDLLEEAHKKMHENMIKSQTTKEGANYDTAKVIAFGALILNDLSWMRRREYIFDLDSTLRLIGSFPVQCQYTHCRISNIIKLNALDPAEVVEPSAFMEPEAIKLIKVIADFESHLLKADESLESALLVSYLSDLVKSSNCAVQKLKVKGTETNLARQRILLYGKAKRVLAEGLTILGAKPLDYM